LRVPTRTLGARAGGPTNLDEFVSGPEYGPEGDLVEVDVDAAREPKRRNLIHQANRRVAGRAATEHEFIDRLSTALDSTITVKKSIRLGLKTAAVLRLL